MVNDLSRRGRVSPFIAMDILAAANKREAEGADIVHLELGQPSAPPPAAVTEAATRAIEAGGTGYTEGAGAAALRMAIADHYRYAYGVRVDHSNVIVTTGSSAGFLLAFIACFDAGARIALARPGYPAYRNILRSLDLVPVEVPVGAETGFRLTPDLLAETIRRDGPVDGLLLASPANPTGTVTDVALLAETAEFCRRRGIRLISDEIYHGIALGGGAPASALAADDDAVVVNSFSKYYCMTGWRIGWMVVPAGLARAVECLSQNLFVCAPTPSQMGAMAAFGCRAELDALVDTYRANRDVLSETLKRAGIGRIAPAEGGFYLYADVSDLGLEATEFCRRALDEAGVAMTPGVDFDPEGGHAFVRLSLAGRHDRARLAADRLADWLPA